MNRDNTKGSFCTETLYGNVFFWHHSKNMLETIKSGMPDSRQYNGSESLNLYFSSALTASVQIDVFASAVSIFNQSVSGCQKL